MRTLPIFLKLDGRKVVVVGHDDAALAKLRLLAKTPADILVVTGGPAIALDGLAETAPIRVETRGFTDADLEGAALIYCSSGDADLDARIYALAHARNIPVNVIDNIPLCDFTTPAIVDRDPISVAISSNGEAPVLARRIRAELERLLPADLGRLAALAGSFRQRLKAILPDGAARRRFWDRIFDDADSTRWRGIDHITAHHEFEILAKAQTTGDARGRVLLVGAGPGDPDLLTVKAQRALNRADVIIYDRLVNPTIVEMGRRDATFLYVGKARGEASVPQSQINATMIEHARAGQTVVRLKSGDPFIFGRAGEEIEALRAAGIDTEIVPGITAAAGIAAATQIPLTHRDHAHAVTFVTGHLKDGFARDWDGLIGEGRSLAVYMGLAGADQMVAGLLSQSVSATLPVAIVENGTRPEERRLYGRLIDLPHLLATHRVASPALIILGEVVRLAADWQESTPHTRQAPVSPEWARALKLAG